MLSPCNHSLSALSKNNDFDKKCSIGHPLNDPKNIKMSDVVCVSIRRAFDQILAFTLLLVRTRSYIFADLETDRVLVLLLGAGDAEPVP